MNHRDALRYKRRTMRYRPAENLFRLARHLAGTRVGLTLDEMAAGSWRC
jgi:hypothetical protein